MINVDIDGWKISKMTLGTVQLGLDYGIANKTGKPSLEKAFKILDAAAKGGIKSFDTANAYGNSEEVLGKYFSSSEYKTGKPFLITKFKIDPLMGTDKKFIEKQIYEFVEKSLERLKIKSIPVYMLHSPKDMSQYGGIVLETLKRLKNEGLIEKAGVSVYKSDEVEQMLKSDFYEAVQLPMNVFDLRMVNSGALKKLKDAGYIVFVRSVFLQGLFFMKPDELPVTFSQAAEPLKQLRKLAQQECMNVGQLVLSFIRDIEEVTSLVLGAETPEQVKENIMLMDSSKLSIDATDKIRRLSSEVPIESIMNQILNIKRK